MKRIRIKIFWAWYDSWIGAYWNKDKRVLYICPLMWIVIAISIRPKEQEDIRCKYCTTQITEGDTCFSCSIELRLEEQEEQYKTPQNPEFYGQEWEISD